MIMVPSLNNFICKDADRFLTSTEVLPDVGPLKYIDMIFNFVSKTVQEDRSSESEQRKALTLYMSVLHNCTGRVDSYIPIINDVVLAKLALLIDVENSATRHVLYQVLGSLLFYNPELELHELDKRGVTSQVFAQWMKEVDGMDGWLTRKMTVLGFLSMLRIPASTLLPHVGTMLPNIISMSVKLAAKMKEDAEKGKKDDNEDEINDEEEVGNNGDDDDWEGFDEDEDVNNKEDEAYMSAMNKLSAGGDISQFLRGDGWDDDDDEVDDDFHSPIDNVDELYFLNDVLKEAYIRETRKYIDKFRRLCRRKLF